jgi:putative FmdB family regulatory protein
MPTYEYLCRKCGHTFEEFQSMSEEPLTRCPECGTDNLARVMGAGGGIIFKGSGFYVTDYRKTDAGGRGDTVKRDAEKKEKAATKSGAAEPAADDAGKKETKKEPGKSDPGKGTPGSQPSSPPPPSGPSGKKD